MDILDDEILKLWKKLYQHNVQYIMIGGFATNLHGYSRTTADLDIWIKDTLENRQQLRKTLADLGLGDFSAIETMDFIPGWSSISLSSGFELDIMTEIRGFPQNEFDDCYKISPTAILYDIPVKFLHLNKLIEAKKAAGREKDILDISELKRINDLKQ